jgi:glycosyltransferase involved in cell wall biosynthesis
MGGYNYQLNLARSVAAHSNDDVSLVIAYGADAEEALVQPFKQIARTTLVQSTAFNEGEKSRGSLRAILTGIDSAAWQVFSSHGVTAIFEPARFFGWRLPVPAVAWIPDFQHRHMPHLFSNFGYWKREIGFRMQMSAGRRILLSSKDAEDDCLRFYPAAIGHTNVARFTSIADTMLTYDSARALAIELGLPEHFIYMPNQMWRHKNHECVIDALALLKSKGYTLTIAVTGKEADDRAPNHVAALRAKVASAGLASNFRMLGTLPYSTIQALMLSCSALLNPSFFEGWSTTVEEAKSLGIPMILSDIPVHHEQAGWRAMYFDPQAPQELADCLLKSRVVSIEERAAARVVAAEETTQKSKDFVASFISAFERRELTS